MAHGEKQASAIALRGVSRPLDLKRNRQSPGLSALQPFANVDDRARRPLAAPAWGQSAGYNRGSAPV